VQLDGIRFAHRVLTSVPKLHAIHTLTEHTTHVLCNCSIDHIVHLYLTSSDN